MGKNIPSRGNSWLECSEDFLLHLILSLTFLLGVFPQKFGDPWLFFHIQEEKVKLEWQLLCISEGVSQYPSDTMTGQCLPNARSVWICRTLFWVFQPTNGIGQAPDHRMLGLNWEGIAGFATLYELFSPQYAAFKLILTCSEIQPILAVSQESHLSRGETWLYKLKEEPGAV